MIAHLHQVQKLRGFVLQHTHMCIHTWAHTPSFWGQGSLRRCSMVHTLRQPVIGSKLFVIRHHIPLLPPVPGFSNLFHLTGGAVYALLLLVLRRRKRACEIKEEEKSRLDAVLMHGTSPACRQEQFAFPSLC